MTKSGHFLVRTIAQNILRRFSKSRGARTLIAAASGAALAPFAEFGRQKKRTYYGAHPCPEKGSKSQQFRGYVRSSEVTHEDASNYPLLSYCICGRNESKNTGCNQKCESS